MTVLDLEDIEKEEVRKGLANSEDFEYDGNEDDYYYKDSI